MCENILDSDSDFAEPGAVPCYRHEHGQHAVRAREETNSASQRDHASLICLPAEQQTFPCLKKKTYSVIQAVLQAETCFLLACYI